LKTINYVYAFMYCVMCIKLICSSLCLLYRYLQKQLEQNNIQNDSSIIDLGCGNGFMLLELFDEGFTNLVGVDYSENAIEVCKAIATDRKADLIKFEVFDLVDGAIENLGQFDVCLDKGTFDAVSLIPDRPQLEVRRKYLQNVHRMLSDDGIFILTSCNWTTDELKVHSSDWFSFVSVIPTATFNFGGVVGNVISIAVLKKKNSSV